MSRRVYVWGLFIGSAIGLIIQIAQEMAQPLGVVGDYTWGGLAISWAVTACLILAHEP
jgi:hypothetical protein